jgi:hypothetical protein
MRFVAANTFWNSCAIPIAATPQRPVRACQARYRRITSTLRSSLPNRTTGMWLSAAKRSTAARNAVPIFSMIAGDGIGLPRCAVINDTTCPPTCRFGTVQIDPIQTLHIQAHMPVNHIVHRHHRSHDSQPGRPSRS